MLRLLWTSHAAAKKESIAIRYEKISVGAIADSPGRGRVRNLNTLISNTFRAGLPAVCGHAASKGPADYERWALVVTAGACLSGVSVIQPSVLPSSRNYYHEETICLLAPD
jgi:hypothetical protein